MLNNCVSPLMLNNLYTRIRCPLLLTGKNSVMPCTIEITMINKKTMFVRFLYFIIKYGQIYLKKYFYKNKLCSIIYR